MAQRVKNLDKNDLVKVLKAAKNDYGLRAIRVIKTSLF